MPCQSNANYRGHPPPILSIKSLRVFRSSREPTSSNIPHSPKPSRQTPFAPRSRHQLRSGHGNGDHLLEYPGLVDHPADRLGAAGDDVVLIAVTIQIPEPRNDHPRVVANPLLAEQRHLQSKNPFLPTTRQPSTDCRRFSQGRLRMRPPRTQTPSRHRCATGIRRPTPNAFVVTFKPGAACLRLYSAPSISFTTRATSATANPRPTISAGDTCSTT